MKYKVGVVPSKCQNKSGSTCLLLRGFLAFYVLIALLMVAASVYLSWIYHWPGAYSDMWKMLDFIRDVDSGIVQLSDFWQVHGGAHRILIPRLFFLIEYKYFSGTNNFLIICSYSFVLLSSLVFIFSILIQKLTVTAEKIFLVAFVLMGIFSITQMDNFLFVFDIQWFIFTCSGVLASWFFALFLQTPSFKRFLPFFFLSFISMYSFFGGVILWICFPLMAFLNRQYKLAGYLALFSFVIFWLYMPSILNTETSFDKSMLPSWYILVLVFFYNILRYVSALLSAPFSESFLYTGISISLLGICAFFVVVYFYIKKRVYDTHKSFLITVVFFMLGVSVAIALGRGFFPDSYGNDRYQTVVVFFWVALLLLLFLSVVNKPKIKVIITIAMVFWSSSLVYYGFQTVTWFSEKSSNVSKAESAILANIYSYKLISHRINFWDISADRNYPKKHANFLQRKQWGVFASSHGKLVGKPLANVDNSLSCQSSIRSIENIPVADSDKDSNSFDVFRITGFAWYSETGRSLPAVLIVNTNNMVTGVALLQRPKGYFWSLDLLKEKYYWFGYTKGGINEEMSLYGWDDGRLCFLQKVRLKA